MKVFVQSTVFLPTPAPGAGAVEYLVAKMARQLADRGHDVAVFGADGSAVPGVTTVGVKIDGLSPQAAEAQLVKAMETYALGAWLPDVLFDHSLTFMAQRAFPHTPAVSMSHGMAPISPWAKNVVFTSKHHGKLHNWPSPRALYLGLDLHKIASRAFGSEAEDYVLWAGRILAYKRPQLAIEMAEAAGLGLVIVGPAIDQDSYYRLLPQIAHSVNVKYLGELDHDQVLDRMRKARAFLFTSDQTEPAGLVMLEALASGCPVIAFDHGANREYLNRHVGALIRTTAEGADLLRDSFWQNHTAAACRGWVESRFSIERMGADAEAYLEEAIAGSRW